MAANVQEPSGAEPQARVFISYSRKDMAFVDRLEPALKARGFEPLIDRSEIYAFEDWWQRLQALIVRADTVVFVLSPDSVASREAIREVDYAATLNKRFAPIVCRRVDDNATPEALRRLNFVFFDDPAQFEASADRLAEALQTDIGWIRQHTEYGEAARHWSAAGRPGGLLLRSPALEQAERWIASRPPNAPAPSEETQAFVAESRRGASRRRNILTGSLAAGLVVALVLAGLAYWQRGIAVEERQIAEQQRQRAEDTLAAATKTANSLVFDLAQRFRDTVGIPANLVKDILDRALALQEQLTKSGELTPDLKRSKAAALDETTLSLLAIGDAAGALSAVQQALQVVQDLAAADPGNAGWQYGLTVEYEKLGYVQGVQGHLADALTSYRDGIAVTQRLAAADPNNAKWQVGLGRFFEKIGDVQVVQGNLQDALASHRDSLAIRERLAKASPDNLELQHDLSLSYERVANIELQQGNLQDALASYGASLAIRERVAKLASNNGEWQRDLSISYERMGDAQVAQGHPQDALESYRKALAVRERLVKSDPSNAGWQRDLAIAYEHVGEAQVAQGSLQDALASYNTGLAIMEAVAKTDPGNATWQSSLSIFYEKLGDVQEAQGDLADALKSYHHSVALTDPLAHAQPSNARWQRALSMSYFRIGDVEKAQGNLTGALASYRDSLAIGQRLTALNPSNRQWQQDFQFFIERIGSLAYDAVLAHDFAMALQAADQAISLAPDKIWLYTNRAYALMFLGRSDEARVVYLRYRGQKDVQPGKSWETVVLEDFAKLRKAGLANSLMDDIEKVFTSAG